jgi:1-aminocyclopropane-1-carboxylate deaminase/D-cysteine desulfhydrase-like pyridoxal-dependent ACC family enzyme
MESVCHAVEPGSYVGRLREGLAGLPRAALATLPTPITRGRLPSGRTLLVKRDDLTGLGMSGNKARKLEFLAGEALAAGADCLVTVGAAQSNHARLTAAAGAVLQLETHLVLGGQAPRAGASGNQLLAVLFGAQLHYPGTDDWDELERAQEELANGLRDMGRRPYTMPIGGSTAIGALGFAKAFDELMRQCSADQPVPSVIVHATSSGGTHAGLLAGRAAHAADGRPVPRIHAVSVAKQPGDLASTAIRLGQEALDRVGLPELSIDANDVEVDGRWLGSHYAVPTAEADDAMRLAARSAALVLDRVYTAKAYAALADLDAQATGDEPFLFWHTGGQPAVFSEGGSPPAAPASSLNNQPKDPHVD